MSAHAREIKKLIKSNEITKRKLNKQNQSLNWLSVALCNKPDATLGEMLLAIKDLNASNKV